MNAQDLKNSILQLAIQGKLVEQRKEDGTAKELIEQIKAEKELLIKEKKIKKEKPLPDIMEDEIPFDIPEGWEWVRLGYVLQIINGDRGKNYPSKDKLTDKGIPFISALNIENQTISEEKLLYMTEGQYEKLGSGKLVLGDLVLCIRGSLGKNGRYPFEKGAIASSLVILRSYVKSDIFYQFITKYINSGLFSKEVTKYNNGTAQPNLGARDLAKFIIPIPPLEEQKRIVAKIEEIMPYIEKYGEAYSKLETFNNNFPEDMQKSILQYAIQGKLVEQIEEEGTAEELYKQIQEEKAKLIKEGKIKKEKLLQEITEDEIPFDIPENWKWVRIGEIFSLQAGKNITSSDIFDNQFEENKYPCYGGNGLRGYVNTFNRDGKYALIGRQGALCGNINHAKDKFYATEHAVVVDHFGLTDVIWGGYFLKALNLNQYATATAQPGLAVSNIVKILIPLPPLEEQKRIVAKIEEMLPYCQQLVK